MSNVHITKYRKDQSADAKHWVTAEEDDGTENDEVDELPSLLRWRIWLPDVRRRLGAHRDGLRHVDLGRLVLMNHSAPIRLTEVDRGRLLEAIRHVGYVGRFIIGSIFHYWTLKSIVDTNFRLYLGSRYVSPVCIH